MFEEYYDSTWLAGAQKRLKEETPELDQLLKAQYHKKKTITPELCQDQRDFFDSTAAYERYLLVVATKIAMLDIYDFKFGVDIAAAQSNIERTQANAEDIFKYLNRDIMKAYKGLDERLQLIARLNWLSILYRMVHDIAKIRGAVHDQKTLLFFRKLNLKENWDKAAGAYRAAENAAKEDVKQPSFDQWMTDFEKTVIEPEEALWKREEIRGAAIRRTKRAVQIVVLCAVSYVIISYAAGFGYVAKMLHHLRPEVVTNTADIDGFGTFPPADIADCKFHQGQGQSPLHGLEPDGRRYHHKLDRGRGRCRHQPAHVFQHREKSHGKLHRDLERRSEQRGELQGSQPPQAGHPEDQ